MIFHNSFRKVLSLLFFFLISISAYSQFLGFGTAGDSKNDGFFKSPVVLEAYWTAMNEPLGVLGVFDLSSSGYMFKLRFNTEVNEQYPHAWGGGFVFRSVSYTPIVPTFYDFTTLENGNKTYYTETFKTASNYQWGLYSNFEILVNGNIILAPKLGIYRSIWTIESIIDIYGESNIYTIDAGGDFTSLSPGFEAKYLVTEKFGFALDYDYNFHIAGGEIGRRTYKTWQLSFGTFLQLWGGKKR